MSGPKTYDEVVEEMYGNRESLIKALHFFNGEANTRELREHGEIPKGSIYDVLDRMVDWDVIEKVGQEPIGRGGQADVFQFTDLGQAIREAVVADGSMTVDEIENLSEMVDRLSGMVETISEKVETHNEIITEHGEAIDDLHEDYEEIQESLGMVEEYIRDQKEDAPARP
jgi:DNA-binding PadR family transcriptional regulator